MRVRRPFRVRTILRSYDLTLVQYYCTTLVLYCSNPVASTATQTSRVMAMNEQVLAAQAELAEVEVRRAAAERNTNHMAVRLQLETEA